jgi:hypothetical protein
METVIKTVSQFEELAGVSRFSSKESVDQLIDKYNINDDDLIADIYQVCGI